MDGCVTLPSSVEASDPLVSSPSPVLNPVVVSSEVLSPSLSLPSLPPSLDPEVPPPSIFSDSDFPPLSCPRPLVNTSYPHSPVTSPSFADPQLQKSLEIFSAKTPLSLFVFPLDSIGFENVTIRKKPL